MNIRHLAAGLLAPGLLAAFPAPAVAQDAVRVPVKEGVLDNGMMILVVERNEIPTVACVVKFRAGAVDETPGTTGVAHILEHMLFKGTDVWGTTDYAAEKPLLDRTEELYYGILAARAALPLDLRRNTEKYEEIVRVSHELGVAEASPESRRDAAKVELLREEAKPLLAMGEDVRRVFALEREFAEVQEKADAFAVDDEDWGILQRNGAWGLNASTGNDSTQYYYSLPANRLELWALVESGRMRNPVLRQFYKERDVIMQERLMRLDNNPGGRLWEALNATAFSAHPYHWPVIGWASDIARVSRTEVEAFFRRYYAPNRAVACIVGDVKFEEVMVLARKYFGGIPRQKDPDPVRTVEPPQRGEKRAVVQFPGLQVPQLAVAYHRPAIGHPDFYVLDVVIGLLSGGNSSRLVAEIYWKERIGGVGAGNGDSLYPELFSFFGRPLPEKSLADLDAAIQRQVERLRDEPVSDRELQKVRNQNAAQMIRNMESNMGLAQTLTSYEILHRWDYINSYQERIAAVTAEDVRRVARKYFRDENKTVVHLVPEPVTGDGGTGDGGTGDGGTDDGGTDGEE